MSERYGAPGELREHLESLEEWLTEELGEARNTVITSDDVHEVRRAAIVLITLGEVLDFILVNPGG